MQFSLILLLISSYSMRAEIKAGAYKKKEDKKDKKDKKYNKKTK